MSKRIFLGLVIGLLCVATSGYAQLKNIDITVKGMIVDEKGQLQDTQLQNKATVYGFYTRQGAEKLYRKMESETYYTADKIADEFATEGKTDKNGRITLQLTPNSTIVVSLFSGELAIADVNEKFSLEVEVRLVKVNAIQDSVVVKESRIAKPEPVVSTRIPGEKWFKYPYPMFPEYTRNNARFGLAVRVMEASSVGSMEAGKMQLWANLSPLIKDGQAYYRTQNRRKNYEIKKHDLLAKYCDTTSWMQTRKYDVAIKEVHLYPLKKGHAYPVYGTAWYEDYNTIYFEDSVCMDEGYDQQPMEFLEFDVVSVPIDTLRYKIPGTVEPVEDKGELHLNFVTGKAEINPADSVGMRELSERRTMMERYYNDPNAQLDAIHIHGQASPEGGYEFNKALALKRSRYLSDMVREWMPGVRNVEISSDVSTWEDVAYELEKDSLKHPVSKSYAASLREIIASTRDMNAQYRSVRSQPYYSYILDTIMPRLRVVNMDFSYVARKVRSRDEIIKMYNTDPGYRDGSKNIMPYEYYVLFDYLQDRPKELEIQAAAAYKNVADPHCPSRKWPLAAYYLANCYLKRDYIDTLLLQPYIKNDYAINFLWEEKDMDGNSKGWYNDPSIICTQIAMCVKCEDARRALLLSHLLPNEERYAMMRTMLKCLNGYWNEEKVRDSVAKTSYMNYAVVYAAQDRNPSEAEFFHRRALAMLQDSTKLDQRDPKVKYMQAQLRFRLEGNRGKEQYTDAEIMSMFTYEEGFEEGLEMLKRQGIDVSEEKRKDYGYPMVECARIDESFVMTRLAFDGYFSKAYREAFKRFWEKEKSKPKRVSEPEKEPELTEPEEENAELEPAVEE